ncbi:sigma-54-dependent transcriptional regulator [Lentisalinibacter salinarum]|uniref:sigma-54-dependent transcriptional regulator n=1 Tax=Lentisalinibacter salinarum TaxID=2992239 RepID=UPI0038637CF1
MARILVADDERSICEAFSAFLEAEGHEALLASSGEEAIRIVREESPAVTFLDVRMPGGDGITALESMRTLAPGMPVIIMTAFGTLDTAKRAMDLGAFDYMGKPVELAQMRELLQKALHKPDSRGTRFVDGGSHGQPVLIGQSAAMQSLFKQIVLLTGNDLSVLVMGESGVGKELVAHAIHDNSPRADKPFIAVNCAAIPDTLIEAELFGAEAGAFTDAKTTRAGRFEAAGDGTLFLDEISELPYHLQSKLLRVLQERNFERLGSVKPLEFRARLIAASNRNLEAEIDAGRFRDDLYHRLNLATVLVPALRDRRDDIEPLAEHFVARASEEMGRAIDRIEPDFIERLKSHSWPGNVRELEHCIKRSVLAAHGPTLTVHDLEMPEANRRDRRQPPSLEQALRTQAGAMVNNPDKYGGEGEIYQCLLDNAAYQLIRAALDVTDGNQVAAAKLLGINRSTLRKKLSEADD